MKKLFKNEKGFTLIELMMVIAVIGILAAVLVPKIGGVKINARMAGVDTNVRTVQAIAQDVLLKYEGKANAEADVKKAERTIISKSSDLVNPISNNTGSEITTANADSNFAQKAVYAVNLTSEDTVSDYNSRFSNLAGSILVVAERDSGDINITLIPFDNEGYPMQSVELTP